jgi:hypothetical protein
MIGSLLKKCLAWLGTTRDLAWFDQRMTLEDLKTIEIPTGTKLKISEQFYRINDTVEVVYQAYVNAKPTDLWPEEWIVFHFVLLPDSTARQDVTQYPTPIPIGTRVFVELLCRPLHRWLKLMVGIEVTELTKNQTLRYDYLEGSVTMGHNLVRFQEKTDDSGAVYTEVHHYSKYLGTSLLLRLIMPFFQKSLHVGFVDAMHNGMKNSIEQRSST